MPEGRKPVKGSRWLSNVPFVKRFRYRAVANSHSEKGEEQDERDFRKSISVHSSAELPAYSKEPYDKPLYGTKETAEHKIPQDDATFHAAESEHTHNDDKIDDSPAFPIPHASV